MSTKITTPYYYTIPKITFIVQDTPPIADDWNASANLLERYYNDVYKLLFAELINFDRAQNVVRSDDLRLESLVRELVKVKSLLETEEQ